MRRAWMTNGYGRFSQIRHLVRNTSIRTGEEHVSWTISGVINEPKTGARVQHRIDHDRHLFIRP